VGTARLSTTGEDLADVRIPVHDPEADVQIGEAGVGARLAERLRHSGQSVSEVRPGAAFSGNEDGSFSIDPNDAREYATLFAALREAGATVAVAAEHLGRFAPVGERDWHFWCQRPFSAALAFPGA